jgi:hypothetical protein
MSKINASTAGATWTPKYQNRRPAHDARFASCNGHVVSAVEIIQTAKTLIAQRGSTIAAKQLLDQFLPFMFRW